MVFAMERLYNYVFGEPVRVQTDHKPLETIWKKRIATASPRLQRLLLRLARYEIQLEYIRSKDNSIADALSRVDPLSPEPQDAKQMDAIPVHQITNAIPATDNRLDRTRIATTADPTESATTLHFPWLASSKTSTSRTSTALLELSQRASNRRRTDIQSSPLSNSHIAESRVSERSSCRALGRGENSTKSTRDSVLARNLG